MYGVIFWEGDKVRAIVNTDGSLKTFKYVSEADAEAHNFERINCYNCRTVSLESVVE